MKRFYFTLIALIATLVASAQTIKVYEYDSYGNLCSEPAYVSSKQVKVVFDDKSGVTDGYEWVDLGLPSGTLWATCNIGANSPEQAGDYFAWGETAPKEEYSWSNYKWCEGSMNTMTKYCNSSEWGVVDNKMTLDPEDDAATVNWGSNWCMPTADQIAELTKSDYTTVEFTTMNDVPVLKITSKKNGNSIVLSPAGYWEWVEEEWFEKPWGELLNSYFNGSESWGFDFWSCEHPATASDNPRQYLANSFHSFSEFMQYYPLGMAYTNHRCNGLPIRPVRVKK
jgi:hypothetical protein